MKKTATRLKMKPTKTLMVGDTHLPAKLHLNTYCLQRKIFTVMITLILRVKKVKVCVKVLIYLHPWVSNSHVFSFEVYESDGDHEWR